MPVPNAPRKKCYNCGNSNHLASFCRKNEDINSFLLDQELRVSLLGLNHKILVFIVVVYGILFILLRNIIVMASTPGSGVDVTNNNNNNFLQRRFYLIIIIVQTMIFLTSINKMP